MHRNLHPTDYIVPIPFEPRIFRYLHVYIKVAGGHCGVDLSAFALVYYAHVVFNARGDGDEDFSSHGVLFSAGVEGELGFGAFY